MRRAAAATSAAGAACALGALARRRWRCWGATIDEAHRRLPGDDLVPEPADDVTYAVTVDAPAEEVWPWLVQMGGDRAGMYSYDWLENAVGLGIHSVDDIRAEWQGLAVGDRITVVPPGWMGLGDGYSFPVAALDPPRSLVLRQCPPEHPWNAVWSFTLEPDGADRCRLVSRSRAERAHGALRVATAAMEPLTMLMTRKMLLGIRERAERRHQRWQPIPAPSHAA